MFGQREPNYSLFLRFDDSPGPEWYPVIRKEFLFFSKDENEAIKVADKFFISVLKSNKTESGVVVIGELLKGKVVIKKYQETKPYPILVQTEESASSIEGGE